jgi:hypothetical protein
LWCGTIGGLDAVAVDDMHPMECHETAAMGNIKPENREWKTADGRKSWQIG